MSLHLNPPGLMDSRRFFSQVVVAPGGTTVYVAGQTGYRVDRSIDPTKEGQMAQAFANVAIALAAAGARLDQVVSIAIYIVDYSEADLEPLARLTAAHFPPGTAAGQHARAGATAGARRAAVRDQRDGGGSLLARPAAFPPHFDREGRTRAVT